MRGRLKNNNVEPRYANYVKMMIDLIGPKNLYLIAGRGMTKTSDVIADRSIDIVHDMPRAQGAIVSDTYVNARTNIIPTLLEGWTEYKGWIEGVHFVKGVKPPEHFDKVYKPIMNWNNTISTFNGFTFKLGSLDQPSGLAGDSFQHIFGDEAKYLDKKKLDTLMPALRGYSAFAHSPFYRGVTFTTDLPNLGKGDYDWIIDQKELMDVDRIEKALQTGLILNEIKHDIYKAYTNKQSNRLANLQKNLERWTVRHNIVRKDLTFFYMVSSLVNLDILTPGYITDSVGHLGIEEFKSSVLSFIPKLEAGEQFYQRLTDEHFIEDGLLSDYVDQLSLADDFEPTCDMLRYHQHDAPLDAGVDFGRQLSMVFGQEMGNTYYITKNLHVLAPESSREMANKFIKFYSTHRYKVLDMYYDRSGNQYESSGRDWAGELAQCIEFDEYGNETGWTVNLMSRNQATIYQSQEYRFMINFMDRRSTRLPHLGICKYQCKELKSSMETTKIAISFSKGIKVINKNKNAEKTLPLHRLPMHSPNYSDAFKYLLYRKSWANVIDHTRSTLPTGLQ